MEILQLTITYNEFWQWYFYGGDDQEIKESKMGIAESIIDQLGKTGIASLSIQELFDNCNHDLIPVNSINETLETECDVALGELFLNYELNLVSF